MGLLAYPYEMSDSLVVSGEDAADFLQSQFSNDLRPFSQGQCTYGLWLDVKGKIVADSWVLCEGEERFRVFSEKCDIHLIKEKLENHIIADDVEIEVKCSLVALALVGQGADQFLADADLRFSLPGKRSNKQSCELVFADEAARRRYLEEGDFEIVSEDWIQRERMRSGISLVHCEVLPGDLPAEGGLVGSAVSLTKGCFLGQEVIARMHNLGRPQRGLYLLSGSGDPPELPIVASNEDGKALGELRTCVVDSGTWKGVAMLKTRFVEPGMQIMIGEHTATVEKAYAQVD